MTRNFDAFCCECGTPKQHSYICSLAKDAGYDALRYFVAGFLGCSTSKAQRANVGAKRASEMIDQLKKEVESK